MKKVVIIHNIISPHVEPLFKEIAKKYDLTVLYCAEREKNRTWNKKPTGYKYKILKNVSIEIGGSDLFTYFINPEIITVLKKLGPDVIISCGWDLFAYQVAFFFAKLHRIKFILWSGSTVNETSWRRSLSIPLVKLIVWGSDAFIAYGTKAKEYLIKLGAKENKVYISYNTTDLTKFAHLCDKYKSQKESIKENLEISNKKVIFYYGQLIKRKGVDLLLQSYKEVVETFSNVTLLLVGSGYLKNDLLTNIEQNNLRFAKVIDDPGDEAICKYYAIADVFVLPSLEEVWGLVVNEAMACGLPVIVSNRAGSAHDLVKNNKNGYIINPNISDIKFAINRMLKSKKNFFSFSQESSKRIVEFYPNNTVNGVLHAIQSVSK
jgi:glycosyltransferase involved in cell wall biosynthesis